MRLISFDGGFGRIEDGGVVLMGPDLVAYVGGAPAEEGARMPLESVRPIAPVPRPEKVIGVGLNYRDHAAESGQPVPEEPVLFAKFANSIIGPGDPILIPRATTQADYEAELGVVIGRPAREVSPSSALSHVAGYLCVNDVSARDLQFKGGQWTRGKAIDTFLPIGPWLVTPEELGDAQDLSIRCVLNGTVVQDSTTAQMVFSVAELVSVISQTISLSPGDIIATGTPPGVGVARDPQVFLQEGDEVTVEIEGIGALTNPVRNRT